MSVTVEFENERFKVLRVKHGGRERHLETSRNERLVIYLREARIKRTEGGKQEEIKRKAGEVIWRGRSQHEVENLNDADHEVIIVEFKK